MNLSKAFGNLPVKYKLLLTYPVLFFLATFISGIIAYSLIESKIQSSIESELGNSTSATLAVFKTSVSVSIQNYLRAIAEKNKDIVSDFYEAYRRGEISEPEAMARAVKVLKSQKIGATGYIYCLNSQGTVMVHRQKALLNTSVTDHPFINEQISRKEGYVEYDWKNPDEESPRHKALYMTYFQPWDWIISASSYRDEFRSLLNTGNFVDIIMGLKFGETGYSFLMDTQGKLLIHPKLQPDNYINMVDEKGFNFIKKMTEMKSGKINYFWKNPGESVFREKMVVFDYLPELDWIVASSGYMDEFYGPLTAVRNTIFVTLIGALLLVLPATIRISSYITNPLKDLMRKFMAGTSGDFTARVKSDSKDELGQLGSYFNAFMEKFEQYSKSLQAEIAERKVAEEALRSSEEKFSKAFKSSPNGLCLISINDMRIMEVNESLMRLTGHSSHQVVGKKATEIGVFTDQEDVKGFVKVLQKNGRVQTREIEFYTKDGSVRMGLISSELFELGGEPVMLAIIEDVTESRRMEREIMEIADSERKRIGQDLHDDLGPHLIGIEVLSKVLHRKLVSGKVDEAPYAERIRNLIQEGIEKTRIFARGLCPVQLEADGLTTSLQDMAQKTEELFGVTCRLKCPKSTLVYDNTVATHLYYITQEAINNAVRHGQATKIDIELISDDSRFNLRISDNGTGICAPKHNKGMGLRTMDYRARVIGAFLRVESRAMGGTVVTCSPPVHS